MANVEVHKKALKYEWALVTLREEGGVAMGVRDSKRK